MNVSRPRDGDGDGFVYDNTPRMRPWNPATDLPYPDGDVPDVVQGRTRRPSAARPVGVTPDATPSIWNDSWGNVNRRRVRNRNKWVDEQSNTHRAELPDGTNVWIIVDVETGRRGVATDRQVATGRDGQFAVDGQLRSADAQWTVTAPDGTETTGSVDGFLPGETAEEFTERVKALALADAPDIPTEVTFYEVGGAVRDDLMGIFSDDVDFAVTAPSYEAMKAHLEAEGFRIFQEREEFATIKAKVPDGHPLQERTHVADFVLARRDGPSSDGRRPDYTEPGTLEEDLARRDFTVNAIARDVDGNLIDPFGGQADIEAGVLRFVGDPMSRVREDGLRVLRGFRFMVTKDLRPDPTTWTALTSNEAAQMLAGVSNERVSNELQKMLDFDTPGAVELLGQLPAPLLDAIFRDGVRLAPNLRQPKGAVRDPDVPRNPFIPVGDGGRIELGSAVAGWERVPGPVRPVTRDDLPRRQIDDWSPPEDEPAVRAAFDRRLGNGYSMRVTEGGRSQPRVTLYASGKEVGFFRWELRRESPTAYLSLAQIDSTHRGQGLGSRAFAASIEALRSMGYDTVDMVAMSNDDANGAYTWARAGVDWEPGSWELPSLAASLAAFARDGRRRMIVTSRNEKLSIRTTDPEPVPYSDEARDEALRIARELTRLGEDLPYDPAEFPDDLPTPNDVAMIGWTPGAEMWLGKDFLSGADPLNGGPLAWSGAMRIDTPAEPEAVTAAPRRDRPRDGDGDGFVYDNTPRMRPWNPVTDLPYPDGLVTDAATVNAIEQYKPRSAVDRAAELLADLPDDPFADDDSKPVRLSDVDRAELRSRVAEAFQPEADRLRDELDDLSNDEALVLAMYGGNMPTALRVAVRRRLAQDPLFGETVIDMVLDEVEKSLLVGLTDEREVMYGVRRAVIKPFAMARVSAIDTPVSRESMDSLQAVIDAVAERGVGMSPNATSLTDRDRERLADIIAAGTVLLADLRRNIDRVRGEVDARPGFSADKLDELRARASTERRMLGDRAADSDRFAQDWLDALTAPVGQFDRGMWAVSVADPDDVPVGKLSLVPAYTSSGDTFDVDMFGVAWPMFRDERGRLYTAEGNKTATGEATSWQIVVDGDDGRREIGQPLDAFNVAQLSSDELTLAFRGWMKSVKDTDERHRIWFSAQRSADSYQALERFGVVPLAVARQTLNDELTAVTREIARDLVRDADSLEGVTSADWGLLSEEQRDDLLTNLRLFAQGRGKVTIESLVRPRVKVDFGGGDGSWFAFGFNEPPAPDSDQPQGGTLTFGDDESAASTPMGWTHRSLTGADSPLGSLFAQQRKVSLESAERELWRDEATFEATKAWAAATLNATQPPKISENSRSRVREQLLTDNVSWAIPDSLKHALAPVVVASSDEPRSKYFGRQGELEPRIEMSGSASPSVYLHEFGHHVETIPPVGRAVWAFYQHRTNNEPLQSMQNLVPAASYGASERSRPDEFYHPYAGKDYGETAFRYSPTDTAHASELLTMGLEGVFFGKRGVTGPEGLRSIDDEHAAFTLGMLFHMGRRAERYMPVEDRSAVTTSSAAATPGVESLAELPTVDAPVIAHNDVVDAAAGVSRGTLQRFARGRDVPDSDAIVNAIRHTRDSLRAAGVDTVTLYRGARAGTDPFDPWSSGLLGDDTLGTGRAAITSWTTDPQRALTYATSPGLTMYRAEVPVDQIVTYDIIGAAATATGWTAGLPLTGREVLVAGDIATVDRMLNRVTDARMVGDEATAPAPV